jgi:glycosyltransferase involved in cell wall biosynthesis
VRIAQVAPLAEPVPPTHYGGTERVVSYLTEELVRRGHDVTLFASGDSRTSARLVAVCPRALRLAGGVDDASSAQIDQIAQVLARAGDFDVIHSHVDYVGFPLATAVSTPSVHTLHGRLDRPYLRPIYWQFRDLAFVSISDAQRAPLADLDLRWAGTVHHGMPLEGYSFSPTPGQYLAFLGRTSPEKGVDRAIAIAKRAEVHLKIAAKVDPADRAYFEQTIRPLLDHPLIEFMGEIGGEAKRELLASALALLFPIDWPEPFGLVMIEAMACGTPVIARPFGSVPEVVAPGTGLLGDTTDELVAAVHRVHMIDRAACRRHVERSFTVKRMVDRYEAIYGRLVPSRRAA